jgi:hypothetical protein
MPTDTISDGSPESQISDHANAHREIDLFVGKFMNQNQERVRHQRLIWSLSKVDIGSSLERVRIEDEHAIAERAQIRSDVSE